MGPDLLLAAHALAGGLIRPDQFAETYDAWAADPASSLGDLLVRRGCLSPADRDAVLARLDATTEFESTGGGTVDFHSGTGASRGRSAPPADELTTDHPGGRPGPAGGVAALAEPPRPTARYRDARLHAVGGIGKVWLARDGHLGRDVALKEIRDDRAGDARTVARFLAEARITGQLEHPSIAPVYDLAESHGGARPFYTMRFVRGRTLAEAARAFHRARGEGDPGPTALRDLVGAVVAVAQAVAYAHSRGVIHRDLKGGNVVLGDFGEVVLLDWGLAKPLGAEADDDPSTLLDLVDGRDETVDGGVLGTPAFMAPEQARGDAAAIGPLSDVYGLGAILYEVLTGRGPFAGAGTREALRLVQEREPERPRSLIAGTPPALEAVCLKALAKDPARRYASAAALADDLRRWLADEPVSAYPEPWPRRLGRWTRRHQSLVAAAAALLITAAVGLSVGLWRVELAKARAETERQRARTSFDLARQFPEKVLVRLAAADLPSVPRLEQLRADLAADAAGGYEQFLQFYPEDAHLYDSAFHVYRQAITAARQVQRFDDALAYTDRGAQLLDRRAELTGSGSAPALERSEIDIDRGNLLGLLGRDREAEAALRPARDRLERQARAMPDAPLPTRFLGYADESLAYVLEHLGRDADALAACDRAIETLGPLAAGKRAVDTDTTLLVKMFNLRSKLRRRAGDLAGAAEDNAEALRRARAFFEAHPSRFDARFDLTVALRERGSNLLAGRSRRDEGLAALEECVEGIEALAGDHPRVVAFRTALAHALQVRGAARPDDLPRARELARSAADEVPVVPDYRARLGLIDVDLARQAIDQGRPADARTLLDEAEACARRVRQAAPDRPVAGEIMSAAAGLRRRLDAPPSP